MIPLKIRKTDGTVEVHELIAVEVSEYSGVVMFHAKDESRAGRVLTVGVIQTTDGVTVKIAR
jgi:hypothetical protein